MPGVLLEMDPQGAPTHKAPQHAFVVSHQKVEIDVDFATQSLIGRCELTLLPQTKDVRTIKIDARQCVITQGGVTVNGQVASFEHEDPMKALNIPEYYDWGSEQFEMQRDRLKQFADGREGTLEITIPDGVRLDEVDPFSENAANAVTQRALGAPAARNSSVPLDGPLSANSLTTPKTAAEQSARFQPLIVSIRFSTKSFRDGLHFVGLAEGDLRYPHVYTRQSMDRGTASCIFPCIDDPAMRITWEMEITCSRTLGDALKRRPAPKSNLHQLLAKKGLTNLIPNDVPEEYEVPLSDEEKLLDMTIVCSGELINETIDIEDSSKKVVTFLCSTSVGPQHIGFAIGPFEQIDLSEYREVEDDEKLGQQTIPLLGYCLPKRGDEIRHTCAALARALDYFMLNFGQYPFTDCRLVFIDDQIRDIEHTAGLSLCSTRLLYGEDIIDPEVENTRILVHAIASQWIGVSVVANQRCDRWTIVGLSHFMTGLFMKDLCGHNEYAFNQKSLVDKLVQLDVERPSLHALGEILHLGSFEYDFMALKAPLVLFILDKRIIKASGTSGLIRAIVRIITTANTGTQYDSVLSTESFRRTVEKITKYRQTETFWNQWILGAGCPKFSITQRFNKKRLCVEMTISQKQDTLESRRKLERSSFMREFKEDVHGIYAGEMQSVFTGPMTIRIHEADGTPYEHIVEIREGVQKIEIPYNTKYKRLKRSRRQKERQNAGHADPSAEGGEDVLYYCLGDVLQSPADMADWKLVEWDADNEAKMEQESYEWIRIDADFEWVCEKHFANLPPYMYISQLQQDRDVVAQQESMLVLRTMPPHPLCATFLIRTLMDTRYFHGIRTLAAECLKTHAKAIFNWAGLKHLVKAYQEFFCFPGDKMPRSNDFSDKRSYKVDLAIIKSLSTVRDDQGKCPKEARQFLLDILRFNDNTNNEHSDNFKVARLLSSLTDSLITIKDDKNVLDVINNDDDDEDDEPKLFQEEVIEALDRYRRMDEWIDSYQNIFTVTVLDCKRRLMNARVIPVEGKEFVQYLVDGNSANIRIKAYECLVDLGFMTRNSISGLLLITLSTDPSPYVRSHLYEVFCLGLATIAFGGDKTPESIPIGVRKYGEVDRDVDMVIEGENDGGLIVEQDVSLDARKAEIARTTTIEGALAALKDELNGNQELSERIWDAVKSTSINLHEQSDLLDVCFVLYDAEESLTVKLRLPRYWKVKYLGKGVLRFKTTTRVRSRPTKPFLNVPAASPKAIMTPVKQPAKQSIKQPLPNPVRLSLSTGAPPGSMRPPKRPCPSDRTPSEERPRKIVKLHVNVDRVQYIQSFPPNPASYRSQSKTKSASPVPRPFPSRKPSPAAKHSTIISPAPVPPRPSPSPAPLTASPGVPGSASGKVRKPLPEGPRKPLPDAPPKQVAEPLPAPKKFLLKLKTNPKQNPQT